MATKDGYMLPRDNEESKRLNSQHTFMLNLSNERLIHPSIPCKDLRAVADVATGTGVWLREVAASQVITRQTDDSTKRAFTGFDISPQQFPSVADLTPGVEFVVHDMTEPFPQYYHEKFDLVNVRLVSYVVKALDLEKVVRNVLQILRKKFFLAFSFAVENVTLQFRTWGIFAMVGV